MGTTWDKAEELAKNRAEWRQREAQSGTILAPPGLGDLKSGGIMVSTVARAYNGEWGQSPSGVQGLSPWSGGDAS